MKTRYFLSFLCFVFCLALCGCNVFSPPEQVEEVEVLTQEVEVYHDTPQDVHGIYDETVASQTSTEDLSLLSLGEAAERMDLYDCVFEQLLFEDRDVHIATRGIQHLTYVSDYVLFLDIINNRDSSVIVSISDTVILNGMTSRATLSSYVEAGTESRSSAICIPAEEVQRTGVKSVTELEFTLLVTSGSEELGSVHIRLYPYGESNAIHSLPYMGLDAVLLADDDNVIVYKIFDGRRDFVIAGYDEPAFDVDLVFYNKTDRPVYFEPVFEDIRYNNSGSSILPDNDVWKIDSHSWLIGTMHYAEYEAMNQYGFSVRYWFNYDGNGTPVSYSETVS